MLTLYLALLLIRCRSLSPNHFLIELVCLFYSFFVTSLVAFITPRGSFDVTAMKSLANDQLSSIMNATRAQLELAVQLHKTVDISIHVAVHCYMLNCLILYRPLKL